MANITYTINESELLESVKEEVAKVAASAYAGDGTPLYESINIFSSEEGVVSNLIMDGVDEIVNRMCDVCLLGSTGIEFDVPDINSSLAGKAWNALDRYIVLQTCSSWFHRKYPQVAESYHADAMAEMTKAVRVLLTRVKPTRS